MLSTKMALTSILMNFSVEKVSKTPYSIEFDPTSIVLMAKGGLPMKFVELKTK